MCASTTRVTYEKLALLDGGIVALTVNSVLGNSHGLLKHRRTLAIGLGLLVVALIGLLLRNLEESRREALMVDQQYCLLATGKIWPMASNHA